MYRIVTDAATSEQIAALPDHALAEFTGVLGVLELVPWNGRALHSDNPDGPVRVWSFGGVGMVVYLILEDQLRIDLVKVVWVD